MERTGSALAEGLYWLAEKFMWGYGDTAIDPAEALKLYKQAADLGWSDAHIRIGELHEYGTGASQNIAEAVASYRRAADAGNYFAYAFIAKLRSRTSQNEKAGPLWDLFFAKLRGDSTPEFVAESVGGLIHTYIEVRLRMDAEPEYHDVIRHHRLEVISH